MLHILMQAVMVLLSLAQAVIAGIVFGALVLGFVCVIY